MSDMSIDVPEGFGDGNAAELFRWLRAQAGTDLLSRVWAKDAAVWTGADEGKWLGWLDIVERQKAQIGNLNALAASVRQEGFTHVAVLGMGGSSLCPYVFATTFGQIPGWPKLHVLDSTDPAQVRAVEAAVDLPRTLFVVSSKSGSTLEPNIFRDYFLDRVKDPKHFIAITDPGSQLEKQAKADGFRAIIAGDPAIGGRFSALSAFGLVPAALMGVDVGRLLESAEAMVRSCHGSIEHGDNPGVTLGTTMGYGALHGVDKLTIIASPAIASFGAWLEQLVAESTGKLGKGIIPVDGEKVAAPGAYGMDRLFVYFRDEQAPDAALDAAVKKLEAAGPVICVEVKDRNALGGEFFRWEFATAVAGEVLRINPFDQPDVEASKIETRRLTDEVEKTGALPKESPQPLTFGGGLEEAIEAHLGTIKPGDYAALLAYVQMNDEHEAALQKIRHRIRDTKKVATTLGFGPRFLHSTGQAYKGGPNSGVFFQITCDDAEDLPVPGRRYSFGVVKAAQARGDFAVLVARKRRALRVHLGPDVAAGLARLETAVAKALG